MNSLSAGTDTGSAFLNSLLDNGWITWVALASLIVAMATLPQVFRRRLGIGQFLGILTFLASALVIPYALQLTLNPTQTSTQAAAAAEPVEVQYETLRQGEVVITWKTAIPVLGAVKYGLSESDLELAAFELDPLDKKTTHEVVISNLESGRTYYFEIISGGKSYSDGGSVRTFTVEK